MENRASLRSPVYEHSGSHPAVATSHSPAAQFALEAKPPIRHEPMRRVQESVFGLLAVESTPLIRGSRPMFQGASRHRVHQRVADGQRALLVNGYAEELAINDHRPVTTPVWVLAAALRRRCCAQSMQLAQTHYLAPRGEGATYPPPRWTAQF